MNGCRNKKNFFFKILFFIFILYPHTSSSDINKELKEINANIIFLRHSIAPGFGDPDYFNLNNCSTQRNLNAEGILQSKNIGAYFKSNNLRFSEVLSSEWCRCKDTSSLAFGSFETKNFLNSFYSSKFAKNKNSQMLDLRKYIKNFKSKKNLVLVTHYVVISEALNYAPSSGEIVISDKKFNIIGTFKTNY